MYYGLVVRGSNKLLKVRTQSNSDGEFCCDTQYILIDSNWEDYPLWLVQEREVADKAAKVHTEWYNAGYDTPSWENKKYDLEVVEVEISIKVNGKQIDLPSKLTIK